MVLLSWVLGGIGVLVVLVLLEMATVVLLPWFPQPRAGLPDRGPGIRASKDPIPNRRDISFQINRVTVRGWLYLPENASQPAPCIVMNNGAGGTKDVVLEQYALRFVKEGIACLTFDYRHFGDSDGQPRQLLNRAVQIEDCENAIGFARSCPEVDPDRIGVWGTSASGGYGVEVAAGSHGIAAVSCQCPSFGTKVEQEAMIKRAGWGLMLRLFVHGQRDKGRGRFGMKPHYIALVGNPGDVALLVSEDSAEGYAGIAGRDFPNQTCARVVLMPEGKPPIAYAGQVRCPVLIQACEKDTMVPLASPRAAAEALGDRAELVTYPIGHFDIYHGEWFEQALRRQIAFYRRSFGMEQQEQPAGGPA